MASSRTTSVPGSLKGRIWFAVTGLAALNCVVGIGVYSLSVFLAIDVLISVVLSFIVSAFMTVVFGWWLANQVLDPLTRLTLAAKSLERSPTSTIPLTTGSVETDALLETIGRTASQIQELIVSMEEIALGRTVPVKSASRTPDRLTVAFQNMVGKIADSVDAGTRYAELEGEIAEISDSLTRLRGGALAIEFRSDHEAARNLAEGINSVAADLRQLSELVRENARLALGSSETIQDSLRELIRSDDARAGRMKLVAGSLSEMPALLQLASKEISAAFEQVTTVNGLIENRKSSFTAISKDISCALTKFNHAIRYIDLLREHSSSLPASARHATDISRRSNMLAINLAVRANSADENRSLTIAVDEIGTMSKRTANMAKLAETAGNSIVRELTALEEFIESVRSDLGQAAAKAHAEAEVDGDLELGLVKILGLRDRLSPLLSELDSGYETSLAVVGESTGSVGSYLRETEEEVAKITRLTSTLIESTDKFRSSVSGRDLLSENSASAPNGRFADLDMDKQNLEPALNNV